MYRSKTKDLVQYLMKLKHVITQKRNEGGKKNEWHYIIIQPFIKIYFNIVGFLMPLDCTELYMRLFSF